MTIVVVATDEEYKLARKRFKHYKIVQTGIGGINVYKKLKRFPKWLKIINFGYVGSNVLPIGKEVRIKKCKLYHPNVDYKEDEFEVEYPWWAVGCIDRVTCYTSNDFVLDTKIEEPCVFDMELAYICMMFTHVESIKIVSDNLSLNEYERSIKNE